MEIARRTTTLQGEGRGNENYENEIEICSQENHDQFSSSPDMRRCGVETPQYNIRLVSSTIRMKREMGPSERRLIHLSLAIKTDSSNSLNHLLYNLWSASLPIRTCSTHPTTRRTQGRGTRRTQGRGTREVVKTHLDPK